MPRPRKHVDVPAALEIAHKINAGAKKQTPEQLIAQIGRVTRGGVAPKTAFERVVATLYGLHAGTSKKLTKAKDKAFSVDVATLTELEKNYALVVGGKLLSQLENQPEAKPRYEQLARILYDHLTNQDAEPVESTPTSVDSQIDEALQILNCPPAQLAIQSMLDKKQWRTNRHPEPPAYGDERGTYITVGDPRGLQTYEQQERALQIVMTLKDETAQMFVYGFSKWLVANQGQPRPQKTRIHVNESLDFRGLERHHSGDFKPEQKRAERDRYLAMSDMWVAGTDWVVPRGKKRPKRVRLYSRLIELEIESEDEGEGVPLTLDLGLPTAQIPYAFRVAPGGWADQYLENPRYMSALLTKALQYRPDRTEERMALRIALYLTFRWGAGVTEYQCNVGQLLAGARIERPTHHPERCRVSLFGDEDPELKGALDRLQSDGVIGSWEALDDLNDLPTHKWWDVWTAKRLAIRAPEAVSEAIDSHAKSLGPPSHVSK